MRGSPANPVPEHGPISTVLKAPPEVLQPERVSTSPYAKPKVLMGEVTAPIQKYAASGGSGQIIAAERDAFRAFMQARRLTPTGWAAAAGVPPNDILAFLTGRARGIAPAIAARLAAVAKVPVEEMFRA